jgi:hypothetical protein
MNFIIYKKADGKPLVKEEISTFLTKETYDSTRNFEHVVKNYGGTKEDYDILWIDEVDPKIYTHEFTVQNSEIIFGEEKVIEELPKEPTEIEKLQKELQATQEAIDFLLMNTMPI